MTNEILHNELPLTFKVDHRADTTQIRDTIWNLAYKYFKCNDWKRLAEHWGFTKLQMDAIEEQWTGNSMGDGGPVDLTANHVQN